MSAKLVLLMVFPAARQPAGGFLVFLEQLVADHLALGQAKEQPLIQRGLCSCLRTLLNGATLKGPFSAVSIGCINRLYAGLTCPYLFNPKSQSVLFNRPPFLAL